MTFPQEGGCLCGGVRYRLSAAPERSWTCHCQQCQRMTGSAFSVGIAVPAASFEILQGELRGLERTADSGRVRTRWVCTQCAVWICGGSDPKQPSATPVRVVLGGTLDDTSWLAPDVHFWTQAKQAWVHLPPGGTVHETQDY